MKKLMAMVFALLLLLAGAGCTNTVNDTDSDILKEPPALTVVCGDPSLEANRGTTSWQYKNEDGTSEGFNSDSLHPLQAKEFMTPLELPADDSVDQLEASLQWDVAPDQVSVHCWSEESWDQIDEESEEIPLNTQTTDADSSSIALKDGNYIYEIVAEWNGNEKYSGMASYSFYTIKASE